MARKALTELRYFPVDIGRVSDSKLRAVVRSKGWIGYFLYDVLLGMIYGDKGYYMEWTEDAMMQIANCALCDDEVVVEVVQEMFRRRLFDVKLFEQYNIFTSAGIQRRYLQAMKDRVRKIRQRGGEVQLFRPEWLLLGKDEMKSLNALNEYSRAETAKGEDDTEFVPDDNDKLKETKPKESETKPEQRRAEQRTDAPCGAPEAPAAPHTLRIGAVALNEMEYAALSGKFGREQVEAKAAHLDAWMKDNGKAVSSCFATLRAWLSDDAAKEKERQKAAQQPVGKRTGAHCFTQRVYDDEELDSLFASDPDRLMEGLASPRGG